jgi:hypothetical protein
MPSRKKAKGQARKANKERQQAEQAIAQQHASCMHSTILENATRDDFIAAHSLLKEYLDRLNATLEDGRDDINEAVAELDVQTYIKYFQYSDVRKQVFREAILSGGTRECVDEANEKDFTKMQDAMRAWHFVELLAYIEVRDKYPGTLMLKARLKLRNNSMLLGFASRGAF